MDIESFREFCLSLPGTTEDVKWDDNLCFMVEEKIFVMASLTPPHSYCFKIEPELFDELVARDGMRQAYHMAKRQWAAAATLDVLPDMELKARVGHSRKLVINKLTKKLQQKYQ